MSWFLRRIKHSETKDKKALMMRNGKVLMGELIASSFGKNNPIRGYCSKELKIATNNYNSDSENLITTGPDYKLYKGFLQDHSISVMKFIEFFYAYKDCFHNIVFACHKSLLRLSGCCLKTHTPILVFESVEYETLAARIYEPRLAPLPLKHRLKIAMDIANAIVYLHLGFSRPIISRDISPSKILFDGNSIAKLFDFSHCESMPEGETRVKTNKVVGTNGFLAPEYHLRGYYNEKCDAYSFGVLLHVLLTGQIARHSQYPEPDFADFLLTDYVKDYYEKIVKNYHEKKFA